MFNIFSTKTKQTRSFDTDFEPPTKKLVTEGDILIKKLSEKQLEKTTTLTKQLNTTREFVGSSEFVPVTNQIEGITTLSNFENVTKTYDKFDKYKTLGLSDDDIQLYEDNLKGFNYVLTKHRNINNEILLKNIKRIEKVINDSKNFANIEPNIEKQKAQDLFTVKPESTETKLLKFALNNETKKEKLPHPMDNIRNLETNLIKNVDLFSNVDVKKIRKKARSLARQINELDEVKPSENKNTTKIKPAMKNSKWDQKEPEINTSVTEVHKKKLYSCKKQNLYTIKDGKIVQIQGDCKVIDKHEKPQKISLEEIKNIDKFKNYEPGVITSKLYLKNMHKNVDENDLLNLLLTAIDKNNITSIDLMKGRMKGQGFIQFKDENIATQALILLNGVLLRNKPIIVQYSKK